MVCSEGEASRSIPVATIKVASSPGPMPPNRAERMMGSMKSIIMGLWMAGRGIRVRIPIMASEIRMAKP